MPNQSEIKQLLSRTGQPWEIRNGKKHNKIILNGVLIAVTPKTRKLKDGWGHRNVVASIKRGTR
jgi:hypothetical protein